MTKREIASKCLQIRDMINSNQYLKAMEEIEHLDFSLIPSIRDIYDYADIFMKAERLDIAKELYYTVYRRRSTRQSLRRLLMLVIRMDDLEEARELLLAYEIICVTYRTFSLALFFSVLIQCQVYKKVSINFLFKK